MNKFPKYKNLEWTSEAQLRKDGIEPSDLDENPFISSRETEEGKIYFNATINGYLLKKGLIEESESFPGVIDIVKLAQYLSKNGSGFSVSHVFGKAERDPSLIETREIKGRDYIGVPLSRVYEFFTTDKIQRDLENIARSSDSIKKQIPEINLSSENYNSFEAFAYLLANSPTMTPYEIANEIGEEQVKIELILYKHNKLILSDMEVKKKIELLKTHEKEKVHKLYSSPDTKNTITLSEFLSSTGISYFEAKRLINHGILETKTLKTEGLVLTKEITKRSILYHLRRVLGNDEEYKKQVQEIMNKKLKLWETSPGYNYDKNRSNFNCHREELIKIPLPTKKAINTLAKRIETQQKGIESIVSATPLMMSKLDEIKHMIEVNNPDYIFYLIGSIRKNQEILETKKDFINKYEKINKLFNQKEKLDNVQSPDIEIKKQISSLGLHPLAFLEVGDSIKELEWDMKIIDYEIREFQEEDEFLKKEFGDTDVPIGQKISENQRRTKINKKKIKKLEEIACMSFNDIQEISKQINAHEKEIAEAKSEMVFRNLRLAAYRAGKRSYTYSFCVEGLIKAVDKFDYTLGYSFSTYAWHWINSSKTRGIQMSKNMIRKPIHIDEALKLLGKTERLLMQELERIPSNKEIFNHLRENIGIKSWSLEKVNNLINLSRQSVYSLDVPLKNRAKSEDSKTTLGDMTFYLRNQGIQNPEECIIKKDIRFKINKILDTLSPIQKKVLQLRMNDTTLDEIGAMFDLSRERIRQIEKIAIERLKHDSRKNKLLDIYEYFNDSE